MLYSLVRGLHPDVPNANFQRVSDIRTPGTSELVKNATGQMAGFKVVLARLFISHFTIETQHSIIAKLGEYVAPGGRLIFDWGTPSESRGHGGRPGDQKIAGVRKVVLRPEFNDMKYWTMSTVLNVVEFRTMVTGSKKTRARDELRAMVQKAGGAMVSYQEDYDRSNSNDISQTIVARAKANGNPRGELPRVQQDFERRLELDRIMAEQPEVAHNVRFGSEFDFRMMFSLVTVVKF